MEQDQREPRTQAKTESGFSGQLVTVHEPAGAAAEDFRTLRTSLLYTTIDRSPKVLVVTSPGPKEGKSTVCANLGVVMAQADKSTLVLDCDLRRPTMHEIFGLRNLRGLVNVLAGENDLPEVWQEPLPGLKVVGAGPVPPNPAELLGSGRFAEFIGKVRQDFDYVLIDAPPTGPVSDPAILAMQGDGVLLAFDAQKTRKGSLRKSKRVLETVGATVLGTVMNNVKARKGNLYSSYTY